MEKNIVDQRSRRRSTEWKAKCESIHDVRRDLSSMNFEMESQCVESIDSTADAFEFQKQDFAKEKAACIVEQKEDKVFHCSLCSCLFVEPVTLDCGHTLCKSCIFPGKGSVQLIDCRLCGYTNHSSDVTVNVLVADLIRKWFPQEYEREVKKLEEVQRKLQGDQEKVVELLSGILRNTPHHITALQWRSHFSRALALEPNLSAECRLEMLSRLTNLLTSESDNPRKEDLLAELKGLPTAEFKSYQCYSNSKALSDYDAENSQAELLKELQKKRNMEQTVGLTVKRSLLGKRSSQKRPFEENEEHFSFCAREIRPKCLKVSTERQLNSSNPSRTAVMKDKEEVECKICYNVLYEPVTTACGHTFCRECLQRSLDYRAECPYCRHTLHCGAERNTKVTRVVKKIVEKLFPEEYVERERSVFEEKARWKGAGVDEDVEVPIFVCMLAFPSLQYPLHIFEPRYRLMIRRCVELGSRMFGMCANTDEPDKSFADYGTMLHIGNVHLLPDGRSIVHTTAGRRFRVVSRSMSNGYNTAKVEWLEDEAPKLSSELQDLEMLNVDCYKILGLWFNSLTSLQQTCITNAIGPMPRLERASSPGGPSWPWWGLAAVPLQDKPKLIILSMISLAERLQSIRRFLELLLRN